MSIPTLVFLWHGLTACLTPYADQQWRDAKGYLTPDQTDAVNHGFVRPTVPDEENFMAHPYLQGLTLTKDPPEAKRLQSFSDTMEAAMGRLADWELSDKFDLRPAVDAIRKADRSLLDGVPPDAPAGRQILTATDRLGIPWDGLRQAIVLRESQLPPTGSLPPGDDYTAPANSLPVLLNLKGLILTAQLRTMAALELGQPALARQTLLIQARIAESHFRDPLLIHCVLGNFYTAHILAQAKVMFLTKSWNKSDLDRLAAWAQSWNGNKILQSAWNGEMLYAVNAIDHFQQYPETADRMYEDLRSMLGNGVTPETLHEACLPFDRPWLGFLSGRAAPLYRIAPAPLFQLWKADAIDTIMVDHSITLIAGGLRYYTYTEEPRKRESKVISYQSLGVNFLMNQSHMHLLLATRALHHWHAAHGDYPESLFDAVSKNPPEWIMDPFSEDLIVYARLSDKSYRLYSVGPDLENDGGVPMKKGKGDLDWSLPEE